VYKVELEMQNESLRETQAALEEARDRYIELFDFAPVGYVTLTGDGWIETANLSGARLLA
jgi:PAS domain-containing protein